jgi:microcystin-dependent protein
MSQTNLFINPSADNGIDLANKLNAWREAIHTSHKGLDRPQYAEAGMFWVCEKSESLWQWYLYDGNQDILVCNFNPIDSTISVNGANSISIEEVPPSNPNPGDLWYESDSGKLYISYVNPEDAVQSWVSTGGNGGGGGDINSKSYSVPVGTIAMWAGAEQDIHPNWAICDGENGTPDLRDRFIVGAGSFYTNGETGGRSSVQLTVDEMPYHTHSAVGKASRMTGTTSAGGGHAHTVNDPGHIHSGVVQNYNNNINWNGTGGAVANTGGGLTQSAITGITIAGAPDHTHTFSVDITGGQVNISGTGGGQAFDITPKFYALCYVMKIVPDGAEIGEAQLGTMSIQNKDAVQITGGSISGITPLPVASGGLGVGSHPANALLTGMGDGPPAYIAPGPAGQILRSNGTAWESVGQPSTAPTVIFDGRIPYNSISQYPLDPAKMTVFFVGVNNGAGGNEWINLGISWGPDTINDSLQICSASVNYQVAFGGAIVRSQPAGNTLLSIQPTGSHVGGYGASGSAPCLVLQF